jgi:ABC-type proline/glycine betaine transport system permease subunit
MSNILPTDNKILNKTIQFYNNVDIGIDSVLQKTETVVDQVSVLLNYLFDFMKNALKKKNLKKVFFILFLSFSMAFLIFGLNIVFGKIII